MARHAQGRLLIGLISGTSADGIDAALVEVRPGALRTRHPRLRLRAFETVPYPRGLRARLLAIPSVAELSHLNAYLGELFARAAITVASHAGVSLKRIEAIGSHGQTVAHQPHLRHEGPVRLRSTLQIGEPSIIAERTGVTTVADFRARDLAAGGQGAPLTPYLHRVLFQHPRRSRLIVNIGGISNMTYLPAGRAKTNRPDHPVVAFDCGPGNMLMDGLVVCLTAGRRQMDRDGRLAARGQVHEGLLRRLLRHPFLMQRPPKTTGREVFGHVLIQRLAREGWSRRLSPADLLATATAFTARAIAGHVRREIMARGPVDEVIVVGGGANNPSLMRMLQNALAPIPVRRSEVFGVNGKAIEAMAFALLAHETLRGVPANLPSVTGARRPVVLGKIIPAAAGRASRRPGSRSGRPRVG